MKEFDRTEQVFKILVGRVLLTASQQHNRREPKVGMVVDLDLLTRSVDLPQAIMTSATKGRSHNNSHGLHVI